MIKKLNRQENFQINQTKHKNIHEKSKDYFIYIKKYGEENILNEWG